MSGKMTQDKKTAKKKTAKRLTTSKRKTSKKSSSKCSPSFSMIDLLGALKEPSPPKSLEELEKQKINKYEKDIDNKMKAQQKIRDALTKNLSLKIGSVTKNTSRKSNIKTIDKKLKELEEQENKIEKQKKKLEEEKEEFEMMCDLADSFGHLGGYKYKKTIKKHKKSVKK